MTQQELIIVMVFLATLALGFYLFIYRKKN
jgi:LPXTG-motif cell wall-anchored protein